MLNNDRREHEDRAGSPFECVGENLGGGAAVMLTVRNYPERDLALRVVFNRAQSAVGSLGA